MPARTALAPLLLLSLSPGCASYWSARLHDAADIATLAVETKTAGVTSRVGPWAVGITNCLLFPSETRGWGLIGGQVTGYDALDNAFFIGVEDAVRHLGDDRRRKEFHVWSEFPLPLLDPQTGPIAVSGLVVPGGGQRHGLEAGSDWRRLAPRYSQVEVLAGLWVGGVRVGVNPGEALDFLLGWFAVDLYGDDSPEELSETSEKPEDRPHPARPIPRPPAEGETESSSPIEEPHGVEVDRWK